MKNLISLTVILSFILFFNICVTSTTKNIQATIKTPNLTNKNVALKLISEFDRMSSVIHVETAYETNTFMIVYKNNTLTEKNIEDVFSKWGCNRIDVSYELVN